MLGLDEESLKDLSKKDKMVMKYMKEVNKVNEDPKFREYMSVEEDQRKIQNSLISEAEERGIEKGIEQGIEKGKNTRNIEIAKNLLQKNIDINIISETTGLSKEEVEKLKK